MNYTFTESDLDTLGVTDSNTRALLLKTTIYGDCESELFVTRWMWGKLNYKKYGLVAFTYTTSYGTSQYVNVTTGANCYAYLIIDGTNLQLGDYYEGTSKAYSNAWGNVSQGSYGGSYNTSSTNVSCGFSNVTKVIVQGKAYFFGVRYDGFKTLTYGNNSIEINVMADTGLTVGGYTGVKHIIYNGNIVKTLNLNGAVHNLDKGITLSNGVVVKRPEDNVISPYSSDGVCRWAIVKTSSTYYLIYTQYGLGKIDDYLRTISNANKTQVSAGSGQKWWKYVNGEWVYDMEQSSSIDASYYTLVGSNEDVYVFSSSSSKTDTIFFAKNSD